MSEVYTRKFSPTDRRLGRHVRHDPKSKAFAYQVDAGALQSIKHTTHTPTLDQGQLGSCTGNAGTKCLSYEGFWETLPEQTELNEDEAVKLYSAATQIDSDVDNYPPIDTGSDGLSVAKVLKIWGLISGYQHALSFEAALTALSKQAVIVGVNWYNTMFTPTDEGELQIGGPLEGGHEFVLDELDVENRRVWMQNSWGDSWGQQGRAWMTYETLKQLLIEQGDCTIFTPANKPAPTPKPTPTDATAQFKLDAAEWLKVKHTTPNNKKMEKDLKKYLATL